MAIFQYKARNKAGSLVIGNMDAPNPQIVSQELGKMGHFPVSITTLEEKKSGGKELGFLERHQKVPDEELVLFTRQLATLFNAGIPLLGALTSLAEQVEHPKFKIIVQNIRLDIEGGRSLSEAMGKHPEVFTDLYVSMIEAGEEGGMIDDILKRLADLLEKDAQLEAEIKAATRYPKMVIGAVAIAIGILMKWVVPVFVKMFQKSNIALPAPTKLLIGFHSIFVEWWLYTLVFFVGLFFAFKKYTATEQGRLKWDLIKLRIPLIGPIVLRSAMAKFARVFGTLQKGGVPILDTIEVSANVVDNRVISGIIRGLRISVQEGLGIAGPLQNSRFVPHLVVQMIAAGEESGALDEMLIKVADYYDEEVARALQRLTVMIEPILIFFMGLMVLFLALSIFLPMWDMSKMAR